MKLIAMLALCLVATTVAACGGDDSSSADESPSSAVVEAREKRLTEEVGSDAIVRYEAAQNGELHYEITESLASRGKVTVTLINPQDRIHDLAVEAPNGKTIGKTDRIGEGVISTTVNLKSGEYVVYCTVPGHRKAGMKGHITVF